MEHDPSILKKVAALEHMDLKQLRLYWNELFERDAPKTYKVQFLRKRLAYRIQELAYGGLSDSTKKRIDEIYAVWKSEQDTKRAVKKKSLPMTGSIISRDYNGIVYEVKIVEDGFEYLGRKWKSLSAIAREITGTRWNGPAFFGLRNKRKTA
ncbi:MAG: DUF2924 domain-containing protein [Planctomycetes bacterium]|nr:DUF2924 domain-containing protein [Planctomycetota bacterium]